MLIEDIIKTATNEFNINGRSDNFIALENEVVKSKNSVDIYFFARYAKGASVKRLQDELIKIGALNVGYYFQQNVEGSDIEKFVKLAVRNKKQFWIGKFVSLAKQLGEFNKIKHLVEGINVNITPKLIQKEYSENRIIQVAQAEYDKNGRTPEFKQLERYMLHHDTVCSSRFFMQRVKGIDLKRFEDIALLRGDPLHMFIIATCIDRADKDFMIRGLELAKLDYRKIEKGWDDIAKEKLRLQSELAIATNARNIEALEMELLHIPTKPEYIAKIDNDYIAQIKYLIKQDYKKKY